MNAMAQRGIPECSICHLPLRERDGTPQELFYRNALFAWMLAHPRCLKPGKRNGWRLEMIGCKPA